MIKFKKKKSNKKYIEVIPIEYNMYEFLHNMNSYKHINLFDVITKSTDADIKRFIKEHPIIDNIINNRNNRNKLTIKRTILPINSVCEFSEIEKFTCVGDKPIYFFKATFLQQEYDAIYLTDENLFELFNLQE